MCLDASRERHIDNDMYEDGAFVCSTTDPDESKEGAETSEIRIKCETSQVIGTSSAWRVLNT